MDPLWRPVRALTCCTAHRAHGDGPVGGWCDGRGAVAAFFLSPRAGSMRNVPLDGLADPLK